MEFSTHALEEYIDHAKAVLKNVRAVNQTDPVEEPQAWIDAMVYAFNEFPPNGGSIGDLGRLYDAVVSEVSIAHYGEDIGFPSGLTNALNSTWDTTAGWREMYRKLTGQFGFNFEGLPSELQYSGDDYIAVDTYEWSEKQIRSDIKYLREMLGKIEDAKDSGVPITKQ